MQFWRARRWLGKSGGCRGWGGRFGEESLSRGVLGGGGRGAGDHSGNYARIADGFQDGIKNIFYLVKGL